MKSITGQKPLCYQLEGSHRVNSLPYIDEERPQFKTKILYLIRSQQNSIPFQSSKYLQSLKIPQTPIIDSPQFTELAESIMQRFESKEEKQKDLKGNKVGEERAERIRKQIIQYENNLVKDLNLQIYQKLGPLLMKKTIQSLENKKSRLTKQIEKQKSKVDEINKFRKYEQLEAQDRQQTVYERTKVMIHKTRKVQ